MFKRRLFLFSCFLLLLACFSCFNADAIQEYGVCGENISYVYDAGSKSVTIGGSGEMYNYTDASNSPFFCTDIVSVEIENGVTSIGDNTFYGSESLKTIIMPDSIISIGSRAFESCCSLSEISFSESLSFIGEGAFTGCESLADVVFSNDIITVSETAFKYCLSLSDVVFLGKIEKIGFNAFSGCSNLSKIHISADLNNIGESVINNIPTTVTTHVTVCEETVNDCLSGEAEIRVYCDVCDATIYRKKIVKQFDSHLFEQYISDNNSSCLTNGTKTAKCERCCKTDTIPDVDSVRAHNWSDWQKSTVETCKTEGEKTRICLNCDVVEKEKISAISHSNSYFVKETKPTCTVNGYEAGYFCPDCETWINGHGVIPASGHTGSIASCRKKAVCSKCGENYGDINPDIHLNITVLAGMEASCSKNGYTESKMCADCKTVIEAKKTIPLKEHTEVVIPGIGVTCTKDGATMGKKCSICGIIITVPQKIPAKGHKEITVPGVEPTCTKEGLSSSKQCSSCNSVLEKAEKIPAKGHIEVIVPGVEATCTKSGLSSSKKCSRCDVVIQAAKKVSAKGHTKVDIPRVEATCTKNGFSSSKICSSCGIVINSAKEIPAKGHKETAVSAVDSTCTKTGLTEGKKCVSCNKITVPQKKTPLKSHKYKATVVKRATKSANGEIVNKCSCGAEKANSTKIIYSPKTFTLSTKAYTYNSNVKTPTVTVKDKKGVTLKKDVDYVVKYESGRKTPGQYTVTITFKDKYSGTKKLYFTIAPKVTNKVTASQTSSSITLKWNNVTGADGYRVYKYNSKTKKYEKIKDVTERSLKVTGLAAGTTYKFKVKAFRKDGGIIWGKATDVYKFATKPASTQITTYSKNTTSVTLKWKKVSGANGYVIYRYSSGNWKRIKTITSGSKISCKINGLKSGTVYKFCIKSYKKSGGSTLWSASSSAISVITNPAAPKLEVTSARKGIASLKWSNVSGESGYQIYYSSKKNGSFKKLATYKADVTKLTIDNLVSGKTYYFKVRSYKKTADGTLYSAWSNVCSIKIK